eukprot:scaffold109729_cov40-Prasinocladus_malaysianus.AAC.2
MLTRLLELLAGFITRTHQSLAAVGVAALVRLISDAGPVMADKDWTQTMQILRNSAMNSMPQVRQQRDDNELLPVMRSSQSMAALVANTLPVNFRFLLALQTTKYARNRPENVPKLSYQFCAGTLDSVESFHEQCSGNSQCFRNHCIRKEGYYYVALVILPEQRHERQVNYKSKIVAGLSQPFIHAFGGRPLVNRQSCPESSSKTIHGRGFNYFTLKLV